MFPTSYFDNPYFAPRYFPKVGNEPTGTGYGKGSRYRKGYRGNWIYPILFMVIKCLSIITS